MPPRSSLSRRSLLELAPVAALGLGAVSVAAAPAAHAATFSDVPTTAMFYSEIMWATDKGIITGYSDGTFRPFGNTDRATMAYTLYRLSNSPIYTAPTRSYFPDVATTHRYYKQICWMVDAGITYGWPDGTYRPNDAVTRDAMASFFYRTAGSPGYMAPGNSPFSDMNPRALHYKEVCWMASTGISTGWPDGTYRPVEPVQRNAMCAFLYRYNNTIATGS